MATLIIDEEVRAEGRHHANEIDIRALAHYQGVLNSLNTQATLVIGFELASINNDNLGPLSNDQSKYCLYKTERLAWAIIFGISTATCLSISLTCIASSFYLGDRAQYCALHRGVRLAVVIVRKNIRMIIGVYVFGLSNFFLSAVSTVWLFLGNANWRTISEEEIDESWCDVTDDVGNVGCGDDGLAVRTDRGDVKAVCLNPYSSDDHEYQEKVSRLYAIGVSIVFIFWIMLGIYALHRMKREFDFAEKAPERRAQARIALSQHGQLSNAQASPTKRSTPAPINLQSAAPTAANSRPTTPTRINLRSDLSNLNASPPTTPSSSPIRMPASPTAPIQARRLWR